MKYFMPVRVLSADGAVMNNASLLAGLGARCILVTGKHAAKKSGALDDVSQALEKVGVPFRVFDEIEQNPSVQTCLKAGRAAHGFGADFVVGIGGGSALDAAKAAAVFAANPGLDEGGFYQKAWDKPPLPIALVGTTSGTGSEVTKVSVLTDGSGRKHSIHDDRLFARCAFGDPRYTRSLSLPVTLSTGIDVLGHCAESYFNKNADEASRAFSVRGIRLLYAPLLAAAEGKELSLEQRRELYDASLLGGLAICGTGTCFPHTLGYYLTENFRVPHGFASARFLPALLDLVREKDGAYEARFFHELDLTREQLSELVTLCLPENTITMTASEIDAALPRWENNNSVRNTCCEVSVTELREILTKLFVR